MCSFRLVKLSLYRPPQKLKVQAAFEDAPKAACTLITHIRTRYSSREKIWRPPWLSGGDTMPSSSKACIRLAARL